MLPTFGPPSHAAVPHQAGSEAPQLQAALPQHGCGHGGQQLVVEDPWHSAAGSCRKVGNLWDLSMIYQWFMETDGKSQMSPEKKTLWFHCNQQWTALNDQTWWTKLSLKPPPPEEYWNTHVIGDIEGFIESICLASHKHFFKWTYHVYHHLAHRYASICTSKMNG